MLTIVLLLLFGLLFLAAEFILIPGTTVVGFVGFAMLAAGLWFSYRDLDTLVALMLLGAVVGVSAFIIYVGLRPKNLDKVALTEVNNATVRDVRRADVLPNTLGLTLSALRPAGTALFGEERREVSTRGEFVAAGSPIKVLSIEQNRIIVAAA